MIPRKDKIILVTIALLVALLYLAAMLYYCRGNLSAPLDDSFIYFQYARQMVQGKPWRYNADDEPSTGATSHLYLAILAAGYRLGFTEERIILFAFGLNTAFLTTSALLVYKITLAISGSGEDSSFQMPGHPPTYRLSPRLASLLFLFNGALLWGYFSCMEVGLFSTLILATLYSFLTKRLWMTILFASLMAISRPEGFILTILLCVLTCVRGLVRARHRPTKAALVASVLWLLPPFIGGSQFLLNYLLTGSHASNGMVAKSWFYAVPFSVRTVIENTARYYLDFFLGPLSGWRGSRTYFPPFLFFLFLLGLLPAAIKEVRDRMPDIATLSCLWLFGGLLATATLMTATWHYYRYQMPFFPLVIIYGTLGVTRLGNFLERRARRNATSLLVLALSALLSTYALLTAGIFLLRYGRACRNIYDQQTSLGRWIDRNLPVEARVAVHDPGALRYFGKRSTYDLIGLTTSGAAEAWRNGSGSVFERLERAQHRPNYFATYPHALLMAFLAKTDLFREEVHRVQISSYEPVASVESEQVVYKADWRLAHSGDRVYSANVLRRVQGLTLVDSVDVADLKSEKEHGYRWWNRSGPIGFPSEVRQFPYRDDPRREVLDGGRAFSGGEEMWIHTQPKTDLLVVARVYSLDEFKLQVRVNSQDAGIWRYSNTEGHFIEATYAIPGELITSELTKFETAVVSGGRDNKWHAHFYYWFWQGASIFEPLSIEYPLQTNLDNKVQFLGYDLNTTRIPPGGTLRLTLYWQALESMEQSYTVFTHLLDRDDKIRGQKDSIPVEGASPTTSWVKGEIVADTHEISVQKNAPPGQYQLEIGMYHLQTGRRLPAFAEGGEPLPDDRILLSAVEVLARKE